MFTGIIEQLGTIHAATPTASGMRLTVEAKAWSYRASRGDSVAVNGCCLTATTAADHLGLLHFDVIPETLEKTTLGELAPGATVNLEHAATAATFLGGHLVQGHIDGVGTVIHIDTSDGWRVRLRLPEAIMMYMAPKGSICLDGVSLTLASINAAKSWIEVALIPTTLEKTTLSTWKSGTRINIEADMLAKTIVHYLHTFSQNSMPSPTITPTT